ncbi:hypothetical protein ACWFNE_02530 [Cellulomonas sp. NPDC055163]
MQKLTQHSRRTMAVLGTTIAMLLLLSAPAQAYTRTWSYSGEFRASLSTSSFNNTAVGEIKITVSPGNCTSGFNSIKFKLLKQNSATIFVDYGTQKTVTCNTTATYTYPSAPTGSYKMYFSRSGPTGQDENWKSVSGTVYYW